MLQKEEKHKGTVSRLKEEVQTEQQTIRNLMKLCDEKDEKMRELEVGVTELEEKHGEI